MSVGKIASTTASAIHHSTALAAVNPRHGMQSGHSQAFSQYQAVPALSHMWVTVSVHVNVRVPSLKSSCLL